MKLISGEMSSSGVVLFPLSVVLRNNKKSGSFRLEEEQMLALQLGCVGGAESLDIDWEG